MLQPIQQALLNEPTPAQAHMLVHKKGFKQAFFKMKKRNIAIALFQQHNVPSNSLDRTPTWLIMLTAKTAFRKKPTNTSAGIEVNA